MLIRSGWVSNSSSSSFIVNKDLSDQGIQCWKIPRDWYKQVEEYANDYGETKIHLDPEKTYWLTEFLVDTSEEFDQYIVGYFDEGDLCRAPRTDNWVCMDQEGREAYDGDVGGV